LLPVSVSGGLGARKDPTDGGGNPSAQGLARRARSTSWKRGPFDHRMDQPRDELGNLVEVARVHRPVERGPGALEQAAGEQ
jgi:hypothetical protein